MTGIISSSDGPTKFRLVYRTDVIMAELHQHKVTGFQRVINLVPTTFVQKCSTAATGLSGINYLYFVLIEHGIGHCTPTPHAVGFLILILHGAVAGNKHHRFTTRAIYLPCIRLYVSHHGLQGVQGWITTSHQPLCCRTGIHHSTETAGVNLIEEEVVIRLP